MEKIAAQEIKTGGLTAIKKLLKQTKELFIEERGKKSCVVVDLEYFNQLKICELEVAYLKAQQDLKNGKFETIANAEEHINQLLIEIDSSSKKANQ